MATNRADTLDPALLRPGRLDRKIEFPTPDRRQKRLIFSTITSKMNLSEEVDLEDCKYRHHEEERDHLTNNIGSSRLSTRQTFRCRNCCYLSRSWYACCPQEPLCHLEQGY